MTETESNRLQRQMLIAVFDMVKVMFQRQGNTTAGLNLLEIDEEYGFPFQTDEQFMDFEEKLKLDKQLRIRLVIL